MPSRVHSFDTHQPTFFVAAPRGHRVSIYKRGEKRSWVSVDRKRSRALRGGSYAHCHVGWSTLITQLTVVRWRLRDQHCASASLHRSNLFWFVSTSGLEGSYERNVQRCGSVVARPVFDLDRTSLRSRCFSLRWISLGGKPVSSKNDKGSGVTGQKESEARPTDRGWTAILRQDACSWHCVWVSARRGLQRSVPSDQGGAVHLVRVQVLIAVVLPRGALLQQSKRTGILKQAIDRSHAYEIPSPGVFYEFENVGF